METSRDNRKEGILSKAKEIAMLEGISKISIRTVAKKSNIAIGTVYNYFPSKNDLLMAVVQDYWEGSIKDIDWRRLADNGFYDNLEIVYGVLFEYLHTFTENWLEQLALLKSHEKAIGRQKEGEYFQKMHDKIIYLMDMDNSVQNYAWSETISKESMAEFIFQNMLIRLKNEQDDIHLLIELLRKIMAR